MHVRDITHARVGADRLIQNGSDVTLPVYSFRARFWRFCSILCQKVIDVSKHETNYYVV